MTGPVLKPGAGRASTCTVKDLAKSFLRDETAATAIEYALIVMGIALLIIAGIQSIGVRVAKPFEVINEALRVRD
ncbi:MAG: Flp family type IVb pilin [Alphaproteobacteria bacterium]|nr:Flp family type IVb pilin [Alphaproteobacteria bacterium]